MIDTHVHIWNLKRTRYSWLQENTTILNRTYLIDELAPDRRKAGVDAGVLVQAANTLEETRYMLEVAQQNEWITGVVGWLPLTDVNATENIVETYRKQSLVKGIRHLIHDEPDAHWLLQHEVIESLKLAAAAELTFDVVGVLDEHLRCAIAIAENIPSLKMVLDHMNHPPIGEDESKSKWFQLIKAAAEYPNIYVKISGLGACLSGSLDEEKIRPYIQFVLEAFGSERCFCGGDWPVSLLSDTYANTWRTYRSVLSSLLNEADLTKVFDTNAAQFYSLNESKMESTNCI